MTETKYVPAAGDLVWGRPWASGNKLARHKGLVLRTLPGTDCVAVWWYGMGAPGAGVEGKPHVQAMFPNELIRAGHFSSASVRQLRDWEHKLATSHLRHVSQVVALGLRINRLHTRLRAARR